MSKYTTEVRFICEDYANLTESKGGASVNQIIEASRNKIFDFDFPIFDESYRPVLETKILKRYYTREICCETVGRWKLFLDTRMNEIMPYFNLLYESANLKYNPFNDVDVTTTRSGVLTGEGNHSDTSSTNASESTSNNRNKNSSSTVNTDSDNWNLYSDTPQGALNGVENSTYLTNATHDYGEQSVVGTGSDVIADTGSSTSNSKTNASGDNNYNNTEEWIEHIVGKRSYVTYPKIIKEWRESFLNIDTMILDALDDLFFRLW